MNNKKLILLATVLLLSSCGNSSSNDSKPVIEGVSTIECIVNSTVDLLNGVIAYDKEEGDITPKMEISIYPYVEVTDGYAVFDTAGDYKITYKVTDNSNNTYIKQTDVNVISRDVYLDFSYTNGFYVTGNKHVSLNKSGMYNSQYKIEATGCETFEDLKLSRVYEISANKEYTFNYYLTSISKGKVRVLMDDLILDELNVVEGNNKLTFKYKSKTTKTSTISLLLGGLGSEVQCVLTNVNYQYEQEPGLTELVNNFSVKSRVDKDGHDATYPEPNIKCSKLEGKIAQLEVIDPYVSSTPNGEPNSNVWRLGMFMNTNIKMEVGKTYYISFQVERSELNHCEVSFQNKEFGEEKYVTYYVNEDQHLLTYEGEITVTNANQGYLWIYVQSGEYSNVINILNLSVKTELDPIKTETLALEDYQNFNDGYNCTFTTFEGGFKYVVESFADQDYKQKVQSPVFYLDGSGSNYIVTFKAKASQPVELVFASPVADGWDPTWVWQKITITEKETIFAFGGNQLVGENGNILLWQFGSVNNQSKHNVTIEITNVQICLKNREYDGE